MKRIIFLTVPGVFLAVVAVTALVFFTRSPVLIVTGTPVGLMYGEGRIRRQGFSASRILFRPVKTIAAADGASSDLLVLAVSQASGRPFCVLFPHFFAEAAGRHHDEFPEIPVVVLSGLNGNAGLPAADGILCIYGTDRNTDLYRAGLLAGIIADTRQMVSENTSAENAPVTGVTAENPQNVVLLQDGFVSAEGRELFSGAVKEQSPDSGVIFPRAVPEVPGAERISCAVITGNGAEYLESGPPVPLVLFTWLDPALVPDTVKVIFDDSPWALTVPAVQMAVAKQAEGQIPSKPLIISGKFADNGIFIRLVKSAEKTL